MPEVCDRQTARRLSKEVPVLRFYATNVTKDHMQYVHRKGELARTGLVLVQ